jgi:hypothetical protein
MRKIPALIAALMLIPLLAFGQEPKFKKIMIFPFKAVTKGVGEMFGNELAGALGAELAREGDVEIVSGKPFEAIVQGRTVDSVRVSRVADRADCQAALWGSVSKLDEG